jgi:competence protein ComEA
MADEDHLLGVRAALPPPVSWPAVSATPVVAAANVAAPAELPPAWPAAAQWWTAGLTAVCLMLLVWRGWGMSRYSPRPLPLERAYSSAIDLNEADEIDLQQIQGIGPALAQRIVEHRRQHGPFATLEELRKVRGIGPQMLDRLRQQVRVDAGYEEVPPRSRVVRAKAADAPDPPPAAGGKKKPPDVPIDINQASVEELKKLPGIGPTLAARIVEARRQRPFAAVSELRRVKGIGPKILERLAPHVSVGPGKK